MPRAHATRTTPAPAEATTAGNTILEVEILKPFQVHAPWHPDGRLRWGRRYRVPARLARQLEAEGRAVIVHQAAA